MALTSHKTSRSQIMMLMILLSTILPLVATFILAPKNPEGRFDNGSTTGETPSPPRFQTTKDPCPDQAIMDSTGQGLEAVQSCLMPTLPHMALVVGNGFFEGHAQCSARP
ncbi:unnamed protein product [Fusarium graminearum]|nr:unnamed protein product [Fusarium graminearum]CAG1968118.1 unnamed protein product [Fusarium graminearum]